LIHFRANAHSSRTVKSDKQSNLKATEDMPFGGIKHTKFKISGHHPHVQDAAAEVALRKDKEPRRAGNAHLHDHHPAKIRLNRPKVTKIAQKSPNTSQKSPKNLYSAETVECRPIMSPKTSKCGPRRYHRPKSRRKLTQNVAQERHNFAKY
jgi:hypothetical protein